MIDIASTKKHYLRLMLSERVRILLSHFGLTQKKMADMVGMSQSNVHAWLNGGAMPQATAMAFQAALGVRWQWLLNGEGEMLLTKADHLPDDLKELADLWPKLSEGDRQYILGAAEGRVAAKGKK